MFKRSHNNRLTKRTTWFHLNCRLSHWKRVLRIPQKNAKKNLLHQEINPRFSSFNTRHLNDNFDDFEESRLESFELKNDFIAFELSIQA